MRKLWTKRRVAGALVLLAGGLVLTLVLSSQSSQHVVLPDGREFTVAKVSYGTKHRYVSGPFWLRGVAFALTKSWQLKLGLVPVEYQTETPSLMVWTRWKNVSLDRQPARVATIAENTVESLPCPARAWGSTSPSEPIAGWAFTNFPRRTTQLIFRVYDAPSYQDGATVAKVMLPNPHRARAEQWTPEPLPQTRSAGDVGFVFEEWTIEAPSSERGAPQSRLRFRVLDGQAADWSLDRVTIRDASGNQTDFAVHRLERSPLGAMLVQLQASPWSTERAFAVEATFIPAPGALAPTRLDRVPVPAPGAALAQELRPGNSVVVIESLQRRGQPPFPGETARPTELVLVTFRSLDPRSRMALQRVVDEQGEQLPWEELNMESADRQLFAVGIPPNIQSLDFVFEVLNGVTVEFLVPNPLGATRK